MKQYAKRLTLLTVLAAACSDDLPGPIQEGQIDASLDAGDAEEDAGKQAESDGGMDAAAPEDAGHDAGKPPRVGLDERPVNDTCIAPVLGEAMPAKLSETGCFEVSDPSKPLEMLVAFDLNAALWSDGASKRRWFALPEGETIALGEDGDFIFPVGTMLVKEFSLDGKRLETRFFIFQPAPEADAGVPDGGVVYTTPTWRGYAYRWSEDQTDAALLEDCGVSECSENEVDLDGAGPGTATWHIPTRTECMTCHTEVANFALGPEIGQLNRDYTYPSTGRTANQLATLSHIGVLAAPLAEPSTLLRFEPYEDNADPLASVAKQARSYLHVNCSMCHRKPGEPMGGTAGVAPEDFRATVSFAEMHVCNEEPKIPGALADLGMDVETAKILAPGEPENSVLWKRMSFRPAEGHTGANRQMPPIASKLVHQQGKDLLETWIKLVPEDCSDAE